MSDGDERKVRLWALAERLAQKIAARIEGARIVPRTNDEKIDVRFHEGGAPVRIVLDVKFDDLEVSARAEGVDGSFSLYRDPEAGAEAEPEADDAWDDVEKNIFLAPSIFVSGTAASLAREAALLQGLPADVLGKLLAQMAASNLECIELCDGVIEVKIDDMTDVRDDGELAVATARVLGRVAGALPRGAGAKSPDRAPLRCDYCRALYYPAPTGVAACANCGAPAREA